MRALGPTDFAVLVWSALALISVARRAGGGPSGGFTRAVVEQVGDAGADLRQEPTSSLHELPFCRLSSMPLNMASSERCSSLTRSWVVPWRCEQPLLPSDPTCPCRTHACTCVCVRLTLTTVHAQHHMS